MRRGGQVSGVVSLVMIFCALSLCVFAVLTLSAADRERRLSELTAQRAAAYYAADAEAVAWVAERTAALPDEDVPDGFVTVRTFPVGETQTLEVEVRKEGGGCRVLRWRTVYTGAWETEETMELWDGGAGIG